MKRERPESNDRVEPSTKRQNTGFNFYSVLSSIGNAIYNVFSSTPEPEGIISQVTNDIQFNIFDRLPPKDLAIAAQVSKKFQLVAMQFFNHYLSSIPSHFCFDDNLTVQKKVLTFSSVCKKIASKFPIPTELINLLGQENIACFYDDLTNRVILYGKVKSSEEDKGKIVSVKYYRGYSRMTDGDFLCSKGKLLPYNFNEHIPATGVFSYRPNEATSLEYLGRLVKGEPCGEVINGIEQKLKTTPEGQSIVRLCDKDGNILDLSKSVNKRFNP